MGKKQHQKDKLYLTATEWRDFYGGKKVESNEKYKFRRLPFYCCSLSMQPFENPYCTLDGVIFDIMNIVPFLKKYGINPFDGKKLMAKDLVKLKFHRNKDGMFHCPVTFKVFNENTRITAIRNTGNVFSQESIDRLNIGPGSWNDLIDDIPFTRKDLLTLQDPLDLTKFNLSNFYHIKNHVKLSTAEENSKKDVRSHLRSVPLETIEALDQLDREFKTKPSKKDDVEVKANAINAALYSTGKASASFTSTIMDPSTLMEPAIVDEQVLLYQRVKKKAYVRITTNLGQLNLELHSDLVPQSCDNFLRLCAKGYYNGTVFHRSIRNFMVQGGDPEGLGTGGESAFGRPFDDQFAFQLKHSGRGVVSYANSGPNSNKSQFFILYRSAPHLDRKHTVFGRLVGGFETLNAIEKVETNKKDRPKKNISIEATHIFVNPFEEAKEQLEEEHKNLAVQESLAAKQKLLKRIRTRDGQPQVFRSGIGKFINPALQKSTLPEEVVQPRKKIKKLKSQLNDFSSW